jgi:phage repressor protein C with HTH and peptisase S24 domain
MKPLGLAERFKWAIERKAQKDGRKVYAADVMRATGVSRTSVSFWLSGENGIDAENARKAAAFLDVNPVWLETGEGTPELQPMSQVLGLVGLHNKVVPFNTDSRAHVEIRKVKLKLSAGITGFATEVENDDGRPISFMQSWFDERGYQPERLVAIKVKGESMEPTMSEGDTVVINTADVVPEDGIIFAVNYEGEAVIKRMLRDNGEWYLSSDNPDQRRYSKKRCADDSCIIIGRIVVLQREKF